MLEKQEIIDWIGEYTTNMSNRNIHINEDMSVDLLNQGIELKTSKIIRDGIKEIPFKFNKIEGSFSACDLGFKSFKNFPNIIEGHFLAFGNEFENTDEIPLKVYGRDFFITSLKGNNISLDFLKKLECSEEIELILFFKNSDKSKEFISKDFERDYGWLINDEEIQLKHDTNKSESFLNYKQLNLLKNHPLMLDENYLNEYLNEYMKSNLNIN